MGRLQSGLLDRRSPLRDRIARLTRFVPLAAGGANSVDCAIAEVLRRSAVRPAFLPRVGRLRSRDPIEAAEGMRIHKTGRTTGYTTGTVFDVSADVSVRYDLGAVIFRDQILIRGDGGRVFSNTGDSGSVIVDRATRRADSMTRHRSTLAHGRQELLRRDLA